MPVLASDLLWDRHSSAVDPSGPPGDPEVLASPHQPRGPATNISNISLNRARSCSRDRQVGSQNHDMIPVIIHTHSVKISCFLLRSSGLSGPEMHVCLHAVSEPSARHHGRAAPTPAVSLSTLMQRCHGSVDGTPQQLLPL